MVGDIINENQIIVKERQISSAIYNDIQISNILDTFTWEQRRALGMLIDKLESPTGELSFLLHTCNETQKSLIFSVIQSSLEDMKNTIVEGTGYFGNG